jgi:hypothetical protein
MYWYKTNDGKQVMLSDNFITIDPRLYFNSENIIQWGHKNEDTGVIDMSYPDNVEVEKEDE